MNIPKPLAIGEETSQITINAFRFYSHRSGAAFGRSENWRYLYIAELILARLSRRAQDRVPMDQRL